MLSIVIFLFSDLLSNIIIAYRGRGHMAIQACFGGPLFSILAFCKKDNPYYLVKELMEKLWLFHIHTRDMRIPLVSWFPLLLLAKFTCFLFFQPICPLYPNFALFCSFFQCFSSFDFIYSIQTSHIPDPYFCVGGVCVCVWWWWGGVVCVCGLSLSHPWSLKIPESETSP